MARVYPGPLPPGPSGRSGGPAGDNGGVSDPAAPPDFARAAADALARLAPAARTVLVAVSGGADSVALLRALEGAPVRVVAAHLDHGLRPESAADAAFVAALAEERGLAVVVESAPVARVAEERGWNLEDAGRRLRYDFLHRAAREAGADVVATGHTRDDQAETVLLQLLRGAAFAAGVPPRRGRVVRPLLELSRADARAYLEGLGQGWREDASNRDAERDRAWLRHEVLPLLEGRRPGVGAALARFGLLQRDAREELERQAAELLGEAGLELPALRRAGPALQRAALAALLRRSGVPVRGARLEEARAALHADRPVRIAVAPDRALRIAYDRVEVVGPPAPAPAPRRVSEPGELPPGAPEALLDGGPLELRGRRPGDRIRLPGGGKSLADLLVDRKVPREERDALRLLARGSEVLWVEGVATAHPHAGSSVDARLMRRALELADEAAAAGELPVGAVVAVDGEVVGEGRNETEARADPSAHAELLALRDAAARRGDWRLADATLYVTLEPCPMCFGALLQAHVPRVVYGARNRREGALGSVADLRSAPWKRRLEVRGGLLADEAAAKLEAFFRPRRAGAAAGRGESPAEPD